MCDKTYTFNELSEESQEKAIENFRDIELQYDWYEDVYYDAELIGLIITDFDLSSNMINGKLIDTPKDVKKAIIETHGACTDTYKLMLDFDLDDEDEGKDFLKALLEEYLSLLKQELDYLYSDEYKVEAIIAHEVKFDSSGRLA